jgi:hypothetical protein
MNNITILLVSPSRRQPTGFRLIVKLAYNKLRTTNTTTATREMDRHNQTDL